MFILTSACGRTFDIVDEHTYALNPHGSICCPSCRSIIESREAWASDVECQTVVLGSSHE